MKHFKLHYLLLIILGFSFGFSGFLASVSASGADSLQKTQDQKIKEPAEFQEVINEYKAYVAKIDPKIRDEVIAYRKEIAKLNKQKRLHYRKLSQDAQEYLKKEQEFKKRLPMRKKGLLKMEKGKAQQK